MFGSRFVSSLHRSRTCVICTKNRSLRRLTFTASWRIWLIVFGPLSMKALRGTQLFSRSSTVSCSRKRILAGNSLWFIKDRIRPKYWSIKDWKTRGGERLLWWGGHFRHPHFLITLDCYLCFLMVESRPHCSHYLTEALQVLPHIFELDSLLLFQKLQSGLKRKA